MSASANDLLTGVGTPGTATTLAAPGFTIGSTSITVTSTSNWPTNTGVVFSIDTFSLVNGVETQDVGSYCVFEGVVASATSITNLRKLYGTDQNYAAGSTTRVYITISSLWVSNLVSWGTAQHSQLDGSHTAITATNVSNSGPTTLTGPLTVKSYDGWITSPDTWVYASATTFTIAGVDRTAQFPIGTKIKLTQTTLKYFYVTAAAFSTNTTITLSGGSDYSLANAAITSPTYSYETTPQLFPQSFAYTSTIANLTLGNGTSVGSFQVIGRQVFFRWTFTLGSTSAVATSPTFTLPLTPIGMTAAVSYAMRGIIYDTSATQGGDVTAVYVSATTMGLKVIATGFNQALTDTITSVVPWTWATGDIIQIGGHYDI